jgi:hypothetical protein
MFFPWLNLRPKRTFIIFKERNTWNEQVNTQVPANHAEKSARKVQAKGG